MITFKGNQYYVSNWTEYTDMLYRAGEYELEELTKDLISDDKAEIRYLEDRVTDFELEMDGVSDSLMCIYNDAEELVDYIQTTKKLDRKYLVAALKSIMEQTGR